jgi:hypothetical protein
MKFIKLTLAFGGNDIYINPSLIASFHRADAPRSSMHKSITYLVLIGDLDDSFHVIETPEQILQLIPETPCNNE